MTATKDELISALRELDTTNDANWTDDGSPRVDVLRGLLNDATVTRAQINEALPGFSRKGDATPEADLAAQTATGGAPDDQPLDADTEDMVLQDAVEELDLNDPTRDQPLDREQVRVLMKKRIDDASQEIVEAQLSIRNANAHLIAVQKRHSRLIGDFNRRFPPLSAAENIKQHLAAHQARKTAAAQEGQGISQVDLAMSQTNRRGWKRPTRPAGVAA